MYFILNCIGGDEAITADKRRLYCSTVAIQTPKDEAYRDVSSAFAPLDNSFIQ